MVFGNTDFNSLCELMRGSGVSVVGDVQGDVWPSTGLVSVGDPGNVRDFLHKGPDLGIDPRTLSRVGSVLHSESSQI